MARKSMTSATQKRTVKKVGPEDPPNKKPSTLSFGVEKPDLSRFEKKKEKSATEMRNDRRALMKDLRTGKIDKKTYDSKVGATRTAEDKRNLVKNAGGSGVKKSRGGKAMKAETRSRSCSAPGKGF
jgi:hypothetical protein